MADNTYTAVVDASGNATVTIHPPAREDWVVQQVTNEMATAPGASACNVRKNGSLISPLVPQSDSAAGEPFVTLLSVRNDTMTVEWTACTPGAIGNVYIIYELAVSA